MLRQKFSNSKTDIGLYKKTNKQARHTCLHTWRCYLCCWFCSWGLMTTSYCRKSPSELNKSASAIHSY